MCIFHLNLIVLRIETEREIEKKRTRKMCSFVLFASMKFALAFASGYFSSQKNCFFFWLKCEVCSFPYSMVFMIILTVWIWNVDKKKSTARMIAMLSVHSVSVIWCYLRFAVVWVESFQRCLCFQLSHRLSRAKRHRTAETYNKTYIHVKCATKSILTEFNYSNSITLS